MAGIRTVARASGWLIAGILGLIVLLYLLLLGINWRDQPPSEAVLHMRALIENRPEVPASDNAYIYVLGFSAPDDADPQQAGEARLAWLESRGYAEESQTPDPAPERNLRAERPEHIQQVFRVCRQGTQSCVVEIDKNMPPLAEWLEPNDIGLARYRQLLDRAEWRERVPDDTRMPLPMYSGVLDGQRLYMVALWKQSADATAIRDGLQKDIAFWRTVLRSSDLLVTKMIAVTALRQHFAYGNVILRNVTPAKVHDAIPASWTEEISVEERSLMRTLAGEVYYVERALDPENVPAWLAANRTFLDRVADALGRPLLQRQDFVNQVADLYFEVAQMSESPLREYPAHLSREKPVRASKGIVDWLYNPLGDVLADIAPGSSLYPYAARTADLEGSRRAALLAAQLRANGATPENIEEQLQQSPLRNPYTDEPFEWDEEGGTIVFNGLSEGERKRQDYLL